MANRDRLALSLGSRIAAFSLSVLAVLLTCTPAAFADNATQCVSGLGLDGKLHAGADAAKVADACLAAARDNPQAGYRAGLILEQGIGRPKNFGAAEDWYRKAAEKGQVQAQFAMGRLSEGHIKDGEALAWFSRAALKNDKPAQEALLRLRIKNPYAMWEAALSAIRIDRSLGGYDALYKSGSGVVIGEQLVLTNAHVVSGCRQVAVAPGLPARVLATDAGKDLAVIKTTIPLGRPATIASGDELGRETKLHTGGYPGEGQNDPNFAITEGNVTERRGSSEGIKDYWLLTNQIHPGNSGGPLMDESGLVVGIVSAELPVTGIVKKSAPKDARNGMAIRAGTVRSFLDKNRIAYTAGGKGPLTDTAATPTREHAAAVTVLVECFE